MTQTTDKMSDQEFQQILQGFKKMVADKQLSVDDAKARIKAAKENGMIDEKQAQQLYQAVAEASKGSQQQEEQKQIKGGSDKKDDNKKAEAKKDDGKKTDSKGSQQSNKQQQSSNSPKIKWGKIAVPFVILFVLATIFITVMMWAESLSWPWQQPAQLFILFGFTAIVYFVVIMKIQFFFPALLALGIAYTLGLCFENYWLLVGSDNLPFIPKLFVADGWDLKNLFKSSVYLSLGFWFTFVFVGLIQAFESEGLRQLGFIKGKRKIDDKKVASGMGFAIFFFLGLDLVVGLPHYSLVSDSFIQFLINAVYLVVSAFGTEVLANVLLAVLEE